MQTKRSIAVWFQLTSMATLQNWERKKCSSRVFEKAPPTFTIVVWESIFDVRIFHSFSTFCSRRYSFSNGKKTNSQKLPQLSEPLWLLYIPSFQLVTKRFQIHTSDSHHSSFTICLKRQSLSTVDSFRPHQSSLTHFRLSRSLYSPWSHIASSIHFFATSTTSSGPTVSLLCHRFLLWCSMMLSLPQVPPND